MGRVFSLEPGEFVGEAPVFGGAGDELAAALRRLRATLDSEGRCWGTDEPGREFEKTYHPDANQTVNNLGSLAEMLRHTGSLVGRTGDELGNLDRSSGTHVRDSGERAGVPDVPPATAPQAVDDAAPRADDSAAPVHSAATAASGPARRQSVAAPSEPSGPTGQRLPAGPQNEDAGRPPSGAASEVSPSSSRCASTAPDPAAAAPTPGSAGRYPAGQGTDGAPSPSPTPAGPSRVTAGRRGGVFEIAPDDPSRRADGASGPSPERPSQPGSSASPPLARPAAVGGKGQRRERKKNEPRRKPADNSPAPEQFDGRPTAEFEEAVAARPDEPKPRPTPWSKRERAARVDEPNEGV